VKVVDLNQLAKDHVQLAEAFVAVSFLSKVASHFDDWIDVKLSGFDVVALVKVEEGIDGTDCLAVEFDNAVPLSGLLALKVTSVQLANLTSNEEASSEENVLADAVMNKELVELSVDGLSDLSDVVHDV
jgi:hypothetical protein